MRLIIVMLLLSLASPAGAFEITIEEGSYANAKRWLGIVNTKIPSAVPWIEETHEHEDPLLGVIESDGWYEVTNDEFKLDFHLEYDRLIDYRANAQQELRVLFTVDEEIEYEAFGWSDYETEGARSKQSLMLYILDVESNAYLFRSYSYESGVTGGTQLVSEPNRWDDGDNPGVLYPGRLYNLYIGVTSGADDVFLESEILTENTGSVGFRFVPEPSAGISLLAGGGALAFLKRRRG